MRLGLIADIHGDMRALEATLARLDELGVDRVVCMGDLVGYGTDHDAAVAAIRDRAIPCVRGNHDRWAVEKRQLLGLRGWRTTELRDDTWEFLESLPHSLRLECDGRILELHHGSPASDTEYVTAYKPMPASVEQFWDRSDAHVLLLGHTHIPMIERGPRGTVINPGSTMGVPGVQTSYTFAVLETDGPRRADLRGPDRAGDPPGPDRPERGIADRTLGRRASPHGGNPRRAIRDHRAGDRRRPAASLLVGLLAVLSWHLPALYGEQGVERVRHDPLVYERYCREIAQGRVPYRDFKVEYPPLAIPIWLRAICPLAPAGNFLRPDAGDRDGRGERGADVAVCWWIVRRGGARGLPGRMTWYAAFFLTLCPVALCRFDLVPALLGFLAATCWFGNRPRWGGGLAAIGTLVKLFPAAVAVPGMAVDLRERSMVRWGLTAFLPTLLAGIACWFAMGGSGVLESIRYHADRGLESGSLYTGLLLIVRRFDGLPMRWVFDHLALELETPGAGWLAALAGPAQAAGLIVVAILASHRRTEDPLRWPAAATLGFLCFGKVLSPQYLLWFLPFAVALEGRLGRRVRCLFLASCVLTTWMYPWGVRLPIVVYNLRNFTLLGTWLLMVLSPSEEVRDEPDRGRRPLTEPGESCPASLALTGKRRKNPGEIDVLRGGTPTAFWAARQSAQQSAVLPRRSSTWINRPPEATTQTRRVSTRSLRSLDVLNFFLADVRDGMGPFLGTFLREVRHWDAGQVGIALAASQIGTVLAQTPAGALIDRITWKRLAIGVAAAAVAVGCIVLYLVPVSWVVIAAQAEIGAAATFFGPAVAAVTLGLVGRGAMPRRTGRNEAFNHAGNVAAAALAGGAAYFFGYGALFFLVAAMAAASAGAVLMIREGDIDHDLARGADDGPGKDHEAVGLAELLKDRRIVMFIVVVRPVPLRQRRDAAAGRSEVERRHAGRGERGGRDVGLHHRGPGRDGPGRPRRQPARRLWGRKPVFLVGLAVLPVRGMLYCLSVNPYYLVGVQLLDGIGAGIFGVVSVLVVADLTKGTGRFNLTQGRSPRRPASARG